MLRAIFLTLWKHWQWKLGTYTENNNYSYCWALILYLPQVVRVITSGVIITYNSSHTVYWGQLFVILKAIYFIFLRKLLNQTIKFLLKKNFNSSRIIIITTGRLDKYSSIHGNLVIYLDNKINFCSVFTI